MIRIQRALLLILLSTGVVLAQRNSQADLQEAYNKETIYLLNGSTYVKNNVIYAGKSRLLQEFSVSPGGLQLYKRSRKNKSIATVISLAGGIGSIAALVSGNRPAIRTFFWVSLGTGLVSSAFSMNAGKQLSQAVWLRNRDAMQLYPGGQPTE
jgi:hypothetical protein